MPTLSDAEVYQLASDGIPRYEYSYGEYDYHYGGLEVLSYEIEGEKAKVLFQDFSATITVFDSPSLHLHCIHPHLWHFSFHFFSMICVS